MLLLTTALLWGLLLAALLRRLLLGLLLLLTTALLWGLLLRCLLLTTTGRIVGGLESGVLLGPPGGGAVRVARRAVAAHRGTELAQVSGDGLSLGLLLTELVEQEVRPQVSQCARPARFEAQLLLGQLHDLRIGDGDAVGLADLLDDGGLDEGARDIDPRRGLTLLPRLLAGLGLHVLGHDVDVLLGHDDGVAGTVQAGERHVGRLAGAVGAARQRPDGEKKCNAGSEDARTCGEASGHGLLLEGTTSEGDMVSQRFWPLTLPFRSRRRTQPALQCPQARFRPHCARVGLYWPGGVCTARDPGPCAVHPLLPQWDPPLSRQQLFLLQWPAVARSTPPRHRGYR